jgi:hypothetical protein
MVPRAEAVNAKIEIAMAGDRGARKAKDDAERGSASLHSQVACVAPMPEVPFDRHEVVATLARTPVRLRQPLDRFG